MSIEKIVVDFTFNYGSHGPRPEATKLFEDTRHQLIVVEDRPCEDCGITYSVLQMMKADATENAKVAHLDMELHHEVEWAAMQADGDLTKAVARLTDEERSALHAAGFKDGDMSPDNLTLFLDGPWNAKHVLCRACHIAQHPTPDFKGIHRVGRHYTPSPNEIAVCVAKDGVDPEAPTSDTPAVAAAKVAAAHIARAQGSPVSVVHPHQGVIHTASAPA